MKEYKSYGTLSLGVECAYYKLLKWTLHLTKLISMTCVRMKFANKQWRERDLRRAEVW